MFSKKLNELKEPLDIDCQLMASELDISVKDIRCISRNMMQDGIFLDSFDLLKNDIEHKGIQTIYFDDNTILYNYLDDNIIIYSNLNEIIILFDKNITRKIENKLSNDYEF